MSSPFHSLIPSLPTMPSPSPAPSPSLPSFLITNPLSSALRDLLTAPSTLEIWCENVTTLSTKSAKVLSLDDYIQLAAIVLGYLMMRPNVMAWAERGRKGREGREEREEKEREKEEEVRERAEKAEKAEREDGEKRRAEEKNAEKRKAGRKGARKSRSKRANDAPSSNSKSEDGRSAKPSFENCKLREVDVLDLDEEFGPGAGNTEESTEARRKRKEELRCLVLESEIALSECLKDDDQF